MIINKIKKIVREKLYEYPIFNRIINELENEKDIINGGDINSFIQSKNKISNKVENQAIKNIFNDNKIDEYKKWKELIVNVLDEFSEKDVIKLKVIEYKFFANLSEEIVAEKVYVSNSTVKKYINDIYMEIGIRAILENLIIKDKLL